MLLELFYLIDSTYNNTQKKKTKKQNKQKNQASEYARKCEPEGIRGIICESARMWTHFFNTNKNKQNKKICKANIEKSARDLFRYETEQNKPWLTASCSSTHSHPHTHTRKSVTEIFQHTLKLRKMKKRTKTKICNLIKNRVRMYVSRARIRQQRMKTKQNKPSNYWQTMNNLWKKTKSSASSHATQQD